MALKLSLNNTDVQVVAALEVKNQRLITALVDRMTFLMTKLQQKIVTEKLSGQVLNRRSGTLAGSITNPEAHVDGTTITGSLQWGGGPAWYGRVHEFGGTRGYAINPIYSRAQQRKIGKGTLAPFKVLRFISKSGQVVFAPYVFHPALPKRSFMESSLEEMKGEIISGLKSAIVGVLKEVS